ncbi:FKBP-type peptidyl-prolyl cis-trans isomerase [Fimbriiglobus ruber]|uniref:Peptidyl-prolyl cis-trans isomerase n=1 Tax=Fimbriiglobus ruber TaxID=1908690 RepID=A0A225DPR6_9BACT|nr:FKBP-type peptidyl-prolyl cis-trans isomerase [Fimbriiglobus ruber]OWK38177.1 FKBP-type peptidyl-prolyl cis-trans isomerase FkpA precursor [Fimbriiglobus ruber]
MLSLMTIRLLLVMVAVVAVAATAAPLGAADDPKREVPKFPALDGAGWKKQDNGLQVWDVKEGTGDAAKAGAMVTIHYTGWLTNGKEFDSSHRRGEAATFPLGSLIKGWQLGIPGMKTGGVRRLMIPSDLGYGDRGAGADIPGKSTLVFEIELIRAWTLPPVDAKEWVEIKGGNGMKMWEVVEGKGDVCKPGATVKIHYTGWLLDGTIFDSSHKRGEAATFPLGNLIKGWQVGVPGMKPGGVRRLLIPHELAYGEFGRPPAIPAKATLLFEMELVGIER